MLPERHCEDCGRELSADEQLHLLWVCYDCEQAWILLLDELCAHEGGLE